MAILSVASSSFYDPPTVLTERDMAAVAELHTVHTAHPLYGVRRFCDELGWSANKARRIRRLAGITIKRPSKKRRTHKAGHPEILAPPNALRQYAVFRDENRPQDGMDYSAMTESGGWVQDFTYIWFERQWHYLALVVNLKTRQVLGWKLGLNHTSELTYAALLDALSKYPAPTILHSDQGSEYLSYKHQLLCQRLEVTLSCSAKSSPWQNGFMERLVETIKDELPPLSQLKDLGQLHEAIALTIHYYNHKRIHTALHMSPAAYAASLIAATPLKASDKVSGKMVA